MSDKITNAPRTLLALMVASTALMMVAPAARAGEPSPDDSYSPRLASRYRIVQLKQTKVAVLVSPDAASPLRQMPVDPDSFDIVVLIDGQEITDASSMENHYGRTSLALINPQTRETRTCWIDLGPLQAGQVAPAAGKMLGVYGDNCVLPIVSPNGPAGYRGLVITGIVPNSPAHRANLRNGLMIAAFNGERIIDMDSLRDAVAKSGRTANILVYAPDGRSRRINVVLSAR